VWYIGGKDLRGKEQEEEEGYRMQLIGNLLEKKNYTDFETAAESRSVWRTIRRY